MEFLFSEVFQVILQEQLLAVALQSLCTFKHSATIRYISIKRVQILELFEIVIRNSLHVAHVNFTLNCTFNFNDGMYLTYNSGI